MLQYSLYFSEYTPNSCYIVCDFINMPTCFKPDTIYIYMLGFYVLITILISVSYSRVAGNEPENVMGFINPVYDVSLLSVDLMYHRNEV